MFSALDYMPVGAFVMRKDWCVLFWNSRMEEWTGINRTQILAQSAQDFLPELCQARYAARLEDVFNHGTPTILSSHLHHHLFPITLPNGQEQIQHTIIMPVPSETSDDFHALFSIEDVTELTARTYKYREMRDKAREAEQKAEQANAAKNRFLANMSHELRTPLNAILGFAQILNNAPDLSHVHKQQVSSIQRGGDYLLTLINDILDFAKIEADQLELLPNVWETQPFFHSLSELFRMNAESKGIQFRSEASTALPAALYCDDKRLRQIIINLLSNAIKFTEQGSVTLRYGFADSVFNLEVIDTGIGIPAARIDTIFHAFTQVGSTAYRQQGTGLGLSITQRLITAMQGTLHVESVEGEGSTFRVSLPIEVVSTLQEAQQNNIRPVIGLRRLDNNAAAMRILITEDLADNRQVLYDLLKPLGFEIAEADSGERCLALLADFQPDLILMDLRLPQIDGLTTTRLLRQQADSVTLPIIAVSAGVGSEDKQRALAAGCNAYISKPVMLTALLDAIGDCLPLAWEYAPQPQKQVSPDADNPSYSLSSQQLTQLDGMLKRGAIKDILTYLQQLVESEHPPHEVETLLVLAQRFQMSQIREYVKKLNSS